MFSDRLVCVCDWEGERLTKDQTDPADRQRRGRFLRFLLNQQSKEERAKEGGGGGGERGIKAGSHFASAVSFHGAFHEAVQQKW